MKMLLRPRECAEILNISLSKFYDDIVKKEDFPKPIKLGKSKLYKYSDIVKWIEELQPFGTE